MAIRSARLRGGFDAVVLHHDQDLRGTPFWRDLETLDGFEARRMVPQEYFEACGELGKDLTTLHDRLTAPNARANMVRAAILATEGGVYLDTDTITLQSLVPLLKAGVFCGEEHVVFPGTVMRSRHPQVWLKSLGLVAVRATCTKMPEGWRTFRRFADWYPRAVNNAVLGAAPGHPFIRRLLESMLAVPEARQRVKFALGTHLLQSQVATHQTPDLVVHSPSVFFPLGPVLSQHWFRMRSQPSLETVLSSDTRVVHWYASVENKRLIPKIDPDYVRLHADRQLFSAAARPFVDTIAHKS